MVDVIAEVIRIILLAFGIEVEFSVLLRRTLYVVGPVAILVLLYVVAWRRVDYYAKLMDRYAVELWTKARDEMRHSDTSRVVAQMRIQRMKKDYSEKISTARKRRDFILKYIPLVKWFYARRYYKQKAAANAPLHSIRR